MLDSHYKIFLEQGLKAQIPAHLKKWKLAEKYAIITDSTIEKLYGQALVKYFRQQGIACELFVFPAGEKSKTLATVEKLAEQMIKKKFHRKDAVIALGGGVVGDLAGFLASIYMRGIPYFQIPTTLMAMVDSAIGGKTGVDLKVGKNLLGRIMQPQATFIDPKYLKTLPQKQIRNGLAEVIKYGVIKDKKLFEFVEKNLSKIFEYDQGTLEHIIEKSVKIKVAIVKKDEQENHERMLLNYGHTYGHALEKMSDYKLLHGYAISIGMMIINKLAIEKGLLSEKDSSRIRNLLKAADLPTTTLKKPSKSDLLSDKKRIGNYLNLVIPTTIGKAIIYKEEC